MRVCVAHDGRILEVKQPIGSFQTVDDLISAFSLLTGISSDSIICMTSGGEQLSEATLDVVAQQEEASLQKAEAAGSESPLELDFFVFNRDFLYSEPDLLAQELAEPEELEPPIHAIDLVDPPTPRSLEALITWSEQCLRPLREHVQRSKELHTRLCSLARSASVALQNLLSHARSINSAAEALDEMAVGEIQRMRGLLAGYESDLRVLSMVQVNARLLTGVNASAGASTTSSKQGATKERTLGDYVSRVKMGAVAAACQKVVDELQLRLDELHSGVVQLDTDTIGLRTEVESTDVGPSGETLEEAVQALGRAEDLLEFVHESCSPDTQGWPAAEFLSSPKGTATFEKVISAVSELLLLDEVARESVRRLTADRNDMQSRSLHLLQDISALQSDYADSGAGLAAVDADLRSNKVDGFRHLARLKNMLWAYGATVVECVRRREFAQHFLSKSQSFAELMAALSASEMKRRATHRSDTTGQLPWEVKNMDDSPPRLEISTLARGSDHILDLGRADIEALFSLLDSVASTFRSEGVAPNLNPIPAVRDALQNLVDRLEEVDEDFSALVEANLLGRDGDDLDLETEDGDGEGSETGIVAARRRRSRRLSSMGDGSAAVKERCARLEREVEETKKATLERETRLGKLHEAELQALRAELTAARAQAQTRTEETERERTSHTRTRAQHDAIKADLDTETARRINLEEEVSHLRREFEAARRESADARHQANEEAEHAAELEVHLHDTQAELEDVKAARADLSSRIESLLNEGSTAEAQLGSAQERINELDAQLAAARSEAREAHDALQDVEGARDKVMRSYRAEADSDRAILEESLRARESDLASARDELRSRAFEVSSAVEDAREQREAAELLRGQLRAADEAHEEIVRSAETARDAASEAESARAQLEIVQQELLDLVRPLLASACEMQKTVRSLPALSRNSSTSANLVGSKSEAAKDREHHDEASSAQSLAEEKARAGIAAFMESVAGSSTEVTLAALRALDASALKVEVKSKVESLTTLVRKWQKACKSSNEKTQKALASARDRIQFRNFKAGDLALFLPTRNTSTFANGGGATNGTDSHNGSSSSLAKPWAAFNISFPHYFLNATGPLAEQLRTKEWVVARITHIEDRVATGPTGNPFQLADGVRFYLLDVEGWNTPASASAVPLAVSRSRKSSSAAGDESTLQLKRRDTIAGSSASPQSQSTKPVGRRQASEGGQPRDTVAKPLIEADEGPDANAPPLAANSRVSTSHDGASSALSPGSSSPSNSSRRASASDGATNGFLETQPLSLSGQTNSPGSASLPSAGPSGLTRALRSRANSPIASRFEPSQGFPWTSSGDGSITSSQHTIGPAQRSSIVDAAAPAFGRGKIRSRQIGIAAASSAPEASLGITREAMANPFSQSPAGPGTAFPTALDRGDKRLRRTSLLARPTSSEEEIISSEADGALDVETDAKAGTSAATANRKSRRFNSMSSSSGRPNLISIRGNSLLTGINPGPLSPSTTPLQAIPSLTSAQGLHSLADMSSSVDDFSIFSGNSNQPGTPERKQSSTIGRSSHLSPTSTASPGTQVRGSKTLDAPTTSFFSQTLGRISGGGKQRSSARTIFDSPSTPSRESSSRTGDAEGLAFGPAARHSVSTMTEEEGGSSAFSGGTYATTRSSETTSSYRSASDMLRRLAEGSEAAPAFVRTGSAAVRAASNRPSVAAGKGKARQR